MDYPNIMVVTAKDGLPARDCLCPQCLIQSIQHKIEQEIDTVAIHQQAPKQVMRFKHQPLIEGLDYTIDNGLWMLSRWFHLKRGTCCGNRCRNCPYGYVKVIEKSN